MPASVTCVTQSYNPPNPSAQYIWNYMNGLIDEEFCTNDTHDNISPDQVPCIAIFYGQDIQGFGTAPHVSIGTNAPNYDNILQDLNLADLTTTGDYVSKFVSTKTSPITNGVPITLRVKSKATATVYDFTCTLYCLPRI